MTAPKPDPAVLLPCPFCGGRAMRITIADDAEVANVGGDVIACTKCQCSTRVFFGEKVGIEEAWNTRAAVLARMDRRAVFEECARVAETNELTGTPDGLTVGEARVGRIMHRETKNEIAAAIRALADKEA